MSASPTRRPVELVLERLECFDLRESGRDRWRARCPAHGGSNPSTLSVGAGDGDVVLLKCWAGCDTEAVARALGLELSDLFPTPRRHARPVRTRRRLLSAQQCLEIIAFECLVTWTAAHTLGEGRALTPGELQRLDAAAERIQTLAAEARA